MSSVAGVSDPEVRALACRREQAARSALRGSRLWARARAKMVKCSLAVVLSTGGQPPKVGPRIVALPARQA